MSIKEEIEPHLDYIVDEIAAMNMFEKERVKTLLLMWFADTIESVYHERAEALAGQAANNQRSMEYGSLSKRDRIFLQNQNTFLKEQRKEARRTANVGKDIKEFTILKAAVNNKYGYGTAIQLLKEAGVKTTNT